MASKTTTLTISTTYVIRECNTCGIQFAVTEDFIERRDDHKGFYCPNGHNLYFPQKSDADKLRDQLKEQERQTKKAEYEGFLYKQEYDREHEAHQATSKQLSTTKGQLTKTKKRIAGGACPCCNRSFVDLHKHMHTQHPEYAADEVTSE